LKAPLDGKAGGHAILDAVKSLSEELLPLKEKLKMLKKDKADKGKISVVEEAIKAISDTRTVLEIIDNINLQGQVVATAMNNLRGLL